MNAPVTIDPAALLAELAALPPERRRIRLRAVEPSDALFDAWCEETDRLAAVEIGQALAASELLVALADEIGAPRVRAESRRARAAVFAYAGRHEEALATSDAAIAIAEAAGLTVAAARARLASVHASSELGRFDAAITAGLAARAAFEAAGEPMLAARADVSLGATHDRRDDPEQALRHYDRALPALSADPTMVAQIESNRGVALIGLDDFARAEEAFQAAVSAFAAAGLGWAAAIAEGNLAYLATRQGRLARALHHFERARRRLETDESPADLARLLVERADAMAVLGMPSEALQTYERALPDLEANGLALEAAQARAGLGRMRRQLGQFDEAAAALARAAADLERLGQQVARARLDLDRAELAAARGQRDVGLLLAEAALQTLAARPADAVFAHDLLARLHLTSGDLLSAAAHVAAALPVAERLDLAPIRARLLHARGLIARRRGAKQEALRSLQSAVEQVERVRGVLQGERFRTAFLGSHLAVYEDAVLAALDGEAPVADAFALVERAKGRALLDVVAGALDPAQAARPAAVDPTEAELLEQVTRLRRELNWHYARFDDAQNDGPSLSERQEWRATLHRLESEFEALEDRLAATRGIAGLYAPSLTLDDALALVPAGAALIEYFIAGDEVLAFVLRDGRADLVRHLTAAADLDERVARVHFQLGRSLLGAASDVPSSRAARQLADVQRDLNALHAGLMAPLASALAGAERLIVVPHGPLHTLPFPALWDGERYLIETHEIVHAPSASLFARLATGPERVTAGAGALVLGVPDGLAPWFETETRHVAAVLGVAPLLGHAATAERLMREGPEAGIIHLATHGRFVSDRPVASGLKLADGWLTVRDIAALRLRASLVTLSGCETGRAAVNAGDELMGLVRGFFAAGASSLLISLWVVSDESTADLMAAFYDAYQRGARPAAALRSAQRALLARQPHPAFWAPFVLGGRP